MDAEDWGAHEHVLHAKIVPVRAREYGIPILRVASSGISQLATADGTVVAEAPFPGQGEHVAGTLSMTGASHIPPDRYLALPAVVAVALVLVRMRIGRGRAG
jgi:apolipoprotein N-acyltransferase